MKAAVMIAAGILVHLWLLWYAYILIMGLYRAKLDNRLTTLTKTLAAPALVVGYLLDWLANWLIASFVFAEPPDEFLELVTDRLSRYLDKGYGWRYRRAKWVCENLLDFFDPRGSHCR